MLRLAGEALNRRAIKSKLLNNPYSRLESVTEIEVAAQLGISIDVNQASIDEWLRLPGISIHQARSLVELIEMGLQIHSLEELAAALSIPYERIKHWAPVLNFSYYHSCSAVTPRKINPNQATLEQLNQIPFLDNALANLIYENRNLQGAYRNLADLQRRLSLTSQTITQLMHHLRF